MKKISRKFTKAVSVLLACMMIISTVIADVKTIFAAEVTDKVEVFSYDVNELEVVTRWGATDGVNENGEYTVTFPKQYSQIFYKVPSEVDVTRIQSISVDTVAENFSLKLALNDGNFTEAGIVYGGTVLTRDKIKTDVDLTQANVICFMSLLDGELVKKVGKITFVVEKNEGETSGETPEETPGEVPGETPEETPEDVNDTEFSYDVNALEVVARWGATDGVNENGEYTVTFPKQYSQIFYKVPSEIDMTRIQSISVDTNAEYFSLKVALNDSSYTEAGVVYGGTTLTKDNIKADVDLTQANIICFMSLGEEELVRQVGKITFILEPKAVEETPEDSIQTEFTFDASQLNVLGNWGVEENRAEDGKYTLNFPGQYNQIFYEIPAEVDMRIFESVSVETSNEHFSVKLCTDDGSFTEAGVVYGNTKLTADNLNGNVANDKINVLAFMSLAEVEGGLSKEIGKVTFKLAPVKAPVTDEKDGTFKKGYKNNGDNNPIVTQRYSADPGVMVYNDTVYVYATNDVYEYDSNGNLKENTFSKVTTINCFSSKDLVNWTDHGAIPVAGKDGIANWAHNSWAPCAAHKTIDGQEKFFLYFADNGSGIGVLTSDSPTGPWVDPIGKQLITSRDEGCEGVLWMFDPAVLVDDDQNAYLVFGGGVPEGKEALPQTTRVVKLGADMISLDGAAVTIDAPYVFEDSGINKVGDKYVYSYCTNWNTSGSGYSTAAIAYMTSDSPMGPYTYAGEILENPGKYFGVWGNNHHSIFEFNGELYIAYHARAVETAAIGNSFGYRSTQINKLTVNENGLIDKLIPDMAGVEQLKLVNPYETVSASTIYRQGGISVSGLGNTVVDVYTGDWLGVKGVDFTQGLSKIKVVVNAPEDTSIEVRVGSEKGTTIGKIEIPATNGEFVEVEGDFEGLSSVRNIYFLFKNEMQFASWVAVPGAIVDVEEAEQEIIDGIEYDVPDLKDAISSVMGNEFITGVSIAGGDIYDEKSMALVTKHFNAVTLGNELKPDCLFGYASKCPTKETIVFNGVEMEVPKIDYSRAENMLDVILKWNTTHPEEQIKMRGHVLTWHSQTPEWFFHEDYDADKPYVSKEEMTLRHEWFIKTVLEHFLGEESKYKDMFYGWDVVNEAVSDGRGTYRNDSENSSWWAVYQSNEFIINAFRFANKYAPADVELYYNDYNEWYEAKSNGIAQLIMDVKNAEGTRIDGVGMQGHYSTDGSPSVDDFMKAARKYGACGVKVQVTELDFGASALYDGTENTLQDEYTREAYRYKDIYEAVQTLREEGIQMSGITIWGVIDKNSWLQTSNSVGGASDGKKKQVPLLFDDYYHVKPAYWAFVDPDKLAPSIKEVVFTQQIDAENASGVKLDIEKGSTKATVKPLWNENELKFVVDVCDDTVDENDAVTVYVEVAGNDIQKVSVLRKDSTATENGYTAVLSVGELSIKAFDEIKFDVVVVNGKVKAAFNDHTLSHEKTNNSKYFAKATLKPFAIVDKGTIVVGKDNSKIWDEVEPIALGVIKNAKARGTAKLLWDEENLYIQMTVVDDVLNADASAAHEKDSVEIFIDENNGKTTSYEADDKQYRINYLNEHTFNGANCVEENISSVVTLTDEGYIVETAIKWTHVDEKAGNFIGLELQVNDADNSGSRIGTANWSDTTDYCWSSPAVFGTVVLVDKNAGNDDTTEEETTVEEETTTEEETETETTEEEETTTEKETETETETTVEETTTEKETETETETTVEEEITTEKETETETETTVEEETTTEEETETETIAEETTTEKETETETETTVEEETTTEEETETTVEEETTTEEETETETETIAEEKTTEKETETETETTVEEEITTEKETETETTTEEPTTEQTSKHYEDLDTSKGEVKDITGTPQADAESNLFAGTIQNKADLEALFGITATEKEQGVNVWVEIAGASLTMPIENIIQIQNALKESFNVGILFDISIFKKVGNNDAAQLTNTNGNLKLSIVIPESLRKDGRVYEIIRVHNGVATVIQGVYDAQTFTFTFETDKFSPYALVYRDVVNENTENNQESTENNQQNTDNNQQNTDNNQQNTETTDRRPTEVEADTDVNNSVNTGDMSPIIPLILVLVAAGAVIITFVFRTAKKKIQ